MNDKHRKKTYEKPAVIHRDKIDVLAAVCDSNWIPGQPCQLIGQPSCLRIR